MKKRAFTLIELLVVITIIALLVAILMPALNKAKKQAKEIVCKSNLNQLSKALAVHAASNNDKLFAFDYSKDHWFRKLAYIFGDKAYRDNPVINENESVMKVGQCPSTKLVPLPAGQQEQAYNIPWDEMWALNADAFAGGSTTSGTMYGSYSINCWLLPPDSQDYYSIYSGQSAAVTAKKYYIPFTKTKSNTPTFFDCFRFDAWPEDDSTAPTPLQTKTGEHAVNGSTTYSMHRVAVDRHGKAIDVSFADGHVEKVPLEELWGLKWNRAFKVQGTVNIYH